MSKIRVIVAISLLGISSCDQLPATKIQNLDVGNADAAAEVATTKNDNRLFAVYGITVEVPGTSLTIEQAETCYGLNYIEGTSDEPTVGRNEELDINARKYAERYNKKVLELRKVNPRIEKDGKIICNR